MIISGSGPLPAQKNRLSEQLTFQHCATDGFFNLGRWIHLNPKKLSEQKIYLVP